MSSSLCQTRFAPNKNLGPLHILGHLRPDYLIDYAYQNGLLLSNYDPENWTTNAV